MRVLQIVTTRRPFFDEQIRALERHGIDCEVLSLPGEPGERTPLEYIRTYPHVLRRSLGDFDIVHANYGTTTPLALLQPRRPVVLTLWGSDIMGERNGVTKRCARYCDEVIVMSDHMAEKLPVDAHVIPHGVDLERFVPVSKERACREVGWNPAQKHVLFPYDPSRDVKNYPLAERVVTTTQQRVDSQVNLHAVHGLDHSDVPLYMNAADVLLLTSRREGSPNSVKEALACNLPVVATDVGDVRERLANISLSTVCETEEELVEAVVSVLNEGRRSNGRNAVRGVSLERMGAEIKRIYELALE